MERSQVNVLQNSFLIDICKECIPVSIYLINGIKLQGQVLAFDSFVVMLKNGATQMVYKHAIATIVPVRTI